MTQLVIKILLILSLVVIGLAFVRNRHAANYSAAKKLFLGLFGVVFVVSVISPGLLTDLAHAVGVGRGTDLLLYVLTMIVIFLSLNTHLRFRDSRTRVDRLARAEALADADRRFGTVTISELELEPDER